MKTKNMNMKIPILKWNGSLRPNPFKTAMTVFFAAFMLLSPFSEAMAEVALLIDDTGQLTGATGVIVGDKTFDVSFAVGKCSELFSGCAEAGNFIFNSFEDAKMASAALEATVILDSEQGNFDSIPSMVRGCTGKITACSIMTPFGFSKVTPAEISDVSFVNVPRRIDIGPFSGASDSVAIGQTKNNKVVPLISVWAVWSTPKPVSP